MKLKEIREQVMSSDVGTNVLHHGTMMPLIRRPNLANGLIPLPKKIKKKKRKKLKE